MPGTHMGGQKAKKKILAKNPNHYVEMGEKGGKAGHKKGWYNNSEAASIAGAKGAAVRDRNRRLQKTNEA